jgi:hypothetical protein
MFLIALQTLETSRLNCHKSISRVTFVRKCNYCTQGYKERTLPSFLHRLQALPLLSLLHYFIQLYQLVSFYTVEIWQDD